MDQAFKRLWGANLFTNLADGLGKTAFPLLAITLTRDPILISIIGALTMLPWLLFAIPIGAIVDNVDRRIALATTNSIRMLIAATISLLIATDHMTIFWLYLVTFIVGICEVFADTISQSLIPAIVKNKELEKANSRMEMTFTVVQDFVGAPIGGLLYAIAIALPFIVNSFGFLIAAILCASIPLPQALIEHQKSKDIRSADLVSEIKFGINYLFNHKQLRRIVITSTTIGFCWSFASSTQILYLVEDLGMNPKKFGFFLTFNGLIVLLGAMSAPQTAKVIGRGLTLAIAIFASSLTIFLQGLVPNIWWFLIPSALNAFWLPHWNILLMSTYQRIIPQDLYGRIHGARRTLIWGMMPIASFLGGIVAKTDLRITWLIGGAIATATTIFSWKFIKSLGDSAVSVDV
jgi:MFS family permease